MPILIAMESVMAESAPNVIRPRARPTQAAYRQRCADVIRRLKLDHNLTNEELGDRLGCSEYVGQTAGLDYQAGRWVDGYGNVIGYSAHEDTTIYDQPGCGS